MAQLELGGPATDITRGLLDGLSWLGLATPSSFLSVMVSGLMPPNHLKRHVRDARRRL